MLARHIPGENEDVGGEPPRKKLMWKASSCGRTTTASATLYLEDSASMAENLNKLSGRVREFFGDAP
jgi:hypothetical protein